MPEVQNPDSINQEQYAQFSSDWLALLSSGSDDALQLAFQAPEVERINFLTFSLDQVLALISAADVHLIKARFILLPDATGQGRFATALFAVDATGHRLSEYYIPTQAAATITQAVGPSAGPSTSVPHGVAMQWLTDWTEATELTTSLFNTSHGPIHGYNFEVSTFQDPLAGAQPYAGKTLFLNCGLSTDPESVPAVLAVYIGLSGSRTPGSMAGIPNNAAFYDIGMACPPAG